jgi:hypothetical protein
MVLNDGVLVPYFFKFGFRVEKIPPLWGIIGKCWQVGGAGVTGTFVQARAVRE